MQTLLRIAASNRQRLLEAALVLLLFAVGSAFLILNKQGQDQIKIDLARTVWGDIDFLAAAVKPITYGLDPDFSAVQAQMEELSRTVQSLLDGNAEQGIEPISDARRKDAQAVADHWRTFAAALRNIVDNEAAWRDATDALITIQQSIRVPSKDAADSVDLYSLYDALARRQAGAGASASASAAINQLLRMEVILVESINLLGRSQDTVSTAATLHETIQQFVANHGSLQDEIPDAQPLVSALSEANARIQTHVQALQEIQLAARQLQSMSSDTIAAAKLLEQRLENTRLQSGVLPALISITGGGSILLLVGFIALTAQQTRRQLREAKQRDESQQIAILSLLDQITQLADGELDIHADVNDPFTGAIADSINYTAQSMQNLVGTITATASAISSAADSTRLIAARMDDAAQRQAADTREATQLIVAASDSMQTVSEQAELLAGEAQSSVRVAQQGADTVQRTIAGMGNLREQIQDTAKRIKRLGESSQEIGNIVELINDIAEETNMLALNASLQATMAGEAGRGFMVVAEKVQGLAERAGRGARQIESLVKTIQADTSEAISSMERSTQNVVSGARSAEEAGEALNLIEQASQNIASLIADIATRTQTQSGTTTHAATTMQAIRQIAEQTSQSATQTVQATRELSELSLHLQASVAGFKLPGEPPA